MNPNGHPCHHRAKRIITFAAISIFFWIMSECSCAAPPNDFNFVALSLTAYRLDAEMDFGARGFTATATLTIRNDSKTEITNFPFTLFDRFQADSTGNIKDAGLEEYIAPRAKSILLYYLTEPLKPGQTADAVIRFRSKSGESPLSMLGFAPCVAYENTVHLTTGCFPMPLSFPSSEERTGLPVDVYLPDRNIPTTIRLVVPENTPMAPIGDIKDTETHDGLTTYRIESPYLNLAFVAGQGYVVESLNYDGIDFQFAYLTEWKNNNLILKKKDMEETARMLKSCYDYYGRRFAPLKTKKIILLNTSTMGIFGLETESPFVIIAMPHFGGGKFHEDFYTLAHEMGHWWWGPPYVRTFPDDAYHETLLRNVDPYHIWLWESSTEFFTFEAMAAVNGTTWLQEYSHYASIGNPPLGERATKSVISHPDELMFNKGVWVWRALAWKMGDKKFARLIHEVFSRFRNDYISREKFEALVAEITEGSYDQFFAEWLFLSAVPDYVISGVRRDRQKGRWIVTVANKGATHMPVPVAAVGNNGKVIQQQIVRLGPNEKATTHFNMNPGISLFEIDPEKHILQKSFQNDRFKIK